MNGIGTRNAAGGGPGASIRNIIATVLNCLSWRLVFVLSGALIILLGASGWMTLKLHRRNLYNLLEQNAIGMGETILSSTYSSMLDNDRQDLEDIIQSIGQREHVLALRLMDARGEVRFSNHPSEIGRSIDLDAPLCQGCHTKDNILVPKDLHDGLQVYHLPGGGDAMGLGVPVLNAPECSNGGCHVHSRDQRVLGMLDLELSTAHLEATMGAASRRMIGLGLLSIAVISGIIGLLAWRVVHRPIHRVLDGIVHLGEGDLSYRIASIPRGEIGDLANSFNRMSTRLEQAKQDLEELNENLEAKVQEKSRELEKTRDQMVFAEKMASLGKLAAIVAHEINNPLAGILVYTKLIRRRLPSLCEGQEENGGTARVSEMVDTLSTIETETARCGDIVRNLLLFSRHREGAKKEPEDLNVIVERALKLVRHQAELASIDSVINLEPDLPLVTCDAGEIEQALLALIMNALEAMADGGTLTVRTGITGDAVRIEISDTGAGIPKEYHSRIFEPFFSTKSEGKGTGLGLSVMYGIINRHQGRIDFESEEGRGASFRVTLPLNPVLDTDELKRGAS